MSGYIPVPPDGWVPTATDATTKLFPTDTMTALSATMDAAVGLIPALENVPAQGFGHSFLASAVNLNPGPGADIGGHALERVAIRCRTAAMSNLAQGGTRSDQILTSIQTNRTPNTRGIVFLGGGHRNDQNYYTNATPNYATVAAVFRSIFANLTARQYDLYSSAAFQFGAGWASGSSSTAGAYVDVAFAGDRAFIAFSAVTGAGGTFIVKNAANATIATVTTGGYGVAFRGMAEVSGLGAGNHTVRVIVQSGTVGIAGIVIPAATPPLIVWELEPPYNEAVVSGGALANTVNAGYQAATTAVAAEFSWASIVTVTAPPTWDASVDTTPDGVHPSASGHRKIADWAITRMKAAGVTFRQGLNWLTGTEADPTTYTVPTVAYQKTGATAPAAPVLTATTGIAIAHTWNLPDDGGATLTSLVLEYSANGTTGWATKATYGPTVTTSNVIAGVTEGVTYYSRMKAVNAVGSSAYSSVVSAVAGPNVLTYSADSFNRADGAAGSTPTGSFAWTANLVADQAKWGIVSNAMTKLTGQTLTGVSPKELLIDDGAADGVLKLTLSGALSTQSGIVFRVAADGQSGLLCDRASDGTYRLRTRTGNNTYVTIFTGTTGLGAPGDVLEITLAGSAISFKVNGAAAGSATSSVNLTATRHGIWCGQATSAVAAYEDWSHVA